MCFGASHAIGIPDFFCPFFVGCVSSHSLALVRGASPEVKAILDGFWFQSTPPRGGDTTYRIRTHILSHLQSHL
jgi:hypothetical protein